MAGIGNKPNTWEWYWRPEGYKVGKGYSVRPSTGTIDPTFARNGAIFRRNASGILEQIATNRSQLEYVDGVGFVAHGHHRMGAGTDKINAVVYAQVGELRAFR